MSIHWGGRGAGHISRLSTATTGVPALSLNFLSGTLDPRITFTRGSNATLVDSTGKITYAPANLLTYSEQFDNAAWVKSGLNTTGTPAYIDVAVSPDGTQNADFMIEDTANSQHTTRVSASLSATTTHTYSFFAKAAGRTNVSVNRFNSGVVPSFNHTFTLTGSGASSGGTVTALSNGWYRCSGSFTTTGTGVGGFIILLSDGTGTTYTGDGTSGIFIWGAQLEPVTYQTTAGPYVATTSAAYYGPRFDYDAVTLGLKGLLIEEQRTNLLTYSEQFDNAIWTKVRATVTADATTSPNGAVNADKLIENTDNNTHFVEISPTVTAVAHSFSVFLKADERGWARLVVVDGAAYFNLSTGAVGTVTAGSVSLSALTPVNTGNGWYRCTVVFTPSAGAATLQVRLATSDGVQSYLGDGTSGIFLWGAQLEAGSFATSYIPTVASQVTRSADVATMTGTNFSSWYNQSEGTFVVGADRIGYSSSDMVFAATDSGSTNLVQQFSPSATSSRFTVRSGGVDQASLDVTVSASAVYKIASAYKANDFASVADGGAVVTDTSGTIPTVDRLGIGSRLSSILYNGHIRQIAYYNTRLANAQLQTLTT